MRLTLLVSVAQHTGQHLIRFTFAVALHLVGRYDEAVGVVEAREHARGAASSPQGAASCARPHPPPGKSPARCLARSLEYALGSTALRAHCALKFAKFQCPDDVLVWSKVPLLGTGKLDKMAIRRRLKEQGYRHPDQRKAKL